jgi:RHS repeat-associated protein
MSWPTWSSLAIRRWRGSTSISARRASSACGSGLRLCEVRRLSRSLATRLCGSTASSTRFCLPSKTAPTESGYRIPGGNKGETSTPNNLYHFGQRYYDPTTGRWTQQDPIPQPGSLVQADRFLFGGADPVNNSDPSGERPNPPPSRSATTHGKDATLNPRDTKTRITSACPSSAKNYSNGTAFGKT